MFNSTILDVAIGMIFVYLLLSLMCSAANEIIVTDVSPRALETAAAWASKRGLERVHPFNVAARPVAEVRQEIEELTGGGVDVVLEMSGAPAAINLALGIVRMGGFLSLLGLPAGHSVTIDDYTRNVIFKGVTMQGIIGRRMYSTWQRMLSLLESGLDVEWVVEARYDTLSDFSKGMEKFDRHQALKVVLFPEGEKAAQKRLAR